MEHETLELLEAVFQTDPGALVVVSGPELTIRMANPAFRAMTPDPSADLVGLPLEHIWRIPAVTERIAALRLAIETGQPLNDDRFEIDVPGSGTRYVAFRLRPLVWRGEPGALLVVWDMTEQELARAHAEQATQVANRRALELAAVLDALPDAVVIYNEEGQIASANQAARALLGFDPMGMDREIVLDRVQYRRADGRKLTPAELPVSQAMKGQQARSQHLLVTDAQGRRLHVLASAAPLFAAERLAGAVGVWSDVTELTQSRQELEAIVQVAGALRDSFVQEEMFALALKQIFEVMHVEGVSILTPDAATGDLVVRAAAGAWKGTVGQRLPGGAGISHRVIEQGTPYLNNQIAHEERLVRTIFLGNLAAGACVPLQVQAAVVGVLWVGRNTPIREEELHLLTAVADIVASGIYRARLFEQTQLRFQRLSALHSIDMAITSSLDLHLTLSVLLDQVVSQLGVDAADILLYDSDLQWLEFGAGRGFLTPPGRHSPLNLTETPARRAALDRETLVVPDLPGSELVVEGWLPQQEAFQAYFAVPLVAKGQVKGVLELFHREVFHPDSEWLEFLETLATQAAIALDSAELFNRLQRTNEELKHAYDATIEGWSRALELRNSETEGHSRRVTEMTIRLARRMGVSDEELAHYRRGVLLHDIGKMGIPDSILLKEGPLTPEDQETMRMHPVYAYELLRPIAYLRPALDIPYSHHEWWDGRGYPRGLRGEEIPLAARIFAVVDVYDALSNRRTYRPAWPENKVIEYIRTRSGTQFDPRVVQAFLAIVTGR
jgi:PAS domain S-box-containing protein